MLYFNYKRLEHESFPTNYYSTFAVREGCIIVCRYVTTKHLSHSLITDENSITIMTLFREQRHFGTWKYSRQNPTLLPGKIIETWSSRMSQKSVATCYWFQDYFYTSNISQEIWKQTLVNSYNIRVYITCLFDLCNNNHVFATSCWFLTLTFTYYLNEINLLKPVTCRYRFPTYSAWSIYICRITNQNSSNDFVPGTIHFDILYFNHCRLDMEMKCIFLPTGDSGTK